MAGIRRTCGSVVLKEQQDDGGAPGNGDSPTLPGIGPISAENPRVLGAGAGLLALLLLAQR